MTNVKGVYKIVNLLNGKKYIGSAASKGGIRKRWNEHISGLNNNKHHNKHLQSSWNKYGKDNFIFEILEVIEDIDSILEREQYYIDTVNPEYNKCRIAGNTIGIKLSDEHKRLISEFAKTRTGEKNPFYGKKHSEGTKKLMLKNKEGKPFKKKKPIKQLSLEGQLIKIWDGAYDAANSLELNQSGINLVLNGKRQKHGGYKWCYL